MAGLFDFFMNGGKEPPSSGQSGSSLFDAFSGGVQAGMTPTPGGRPGMPQGDGLQMAMRLAQSPTPETARQIIQQLHQMKNPEAAQFEQMLTGVMDNPQALKQLADAVVQKLGAQNA